MGRRYRGVEGASRAALYVVAPRFPEHLPQAHAIAGLTPGVVGYTLLGNGIAGVAFGRLYWKHGLVTAMAAHFVTDVVRHVIAPLARA